MNKKNVLVVSNKLLGNNSLSEWTAVIHPFDVNVVNNDETAIELCHRNRYDMVVVDGTDLEVDSKKLHAVLPILQDDITVLRYEGETVKELEENVKAVFDARKYKRIQRMLMLEPSVSAFSNLPAFSLN
jgi:hypothetical protein